MHFFLFIRAFLFPCDLQLELEYWAETGEFDEDELHEVCTQLPDQILHILFQCMIVQTDCQGLIWMRDIRVKKRMRK